MDVLDTEFAGYIESKKLKSLTVAKLKEFANAKDLIQTG